MIIMPFIIICVISYIVLKFDEMLKIISAGYYDFYGCIEAACVGKLKLKLLQYPSISVWLNVRCILVLQYPSVSVWLNVWCIFVLQNLSLFVWINLRCILVCVDKQGD